MKISTVSHTAGGKTQIPHRIELMDRDEGVFRKALFFRLTLPPDADSLCINPGDTDLNVRFEPVIYNAINNSRESLRATISMRDHLVMVKFPLPVHIVSIRLFSSRGASPSYQIEIYRVDGEAVSPEPSETAHYYVNSGTMTGSQEHPHASTTFPVYKACSEAVGHDIDSYGMQGERKLKLSAAAVEYRCSIKGDSFALRLVTPGGESVNGFNNNWLSDILISSQPASPSVSMKAPGMEKESGAITQDGGTSYLLATEPGEQGGGETPDAWAMALKNPLLRALKDALGRIERDSQKDSPSAIPLDFVLVFASGSPCAANVSDFSIGYHCRKRCLIDKTLEKKALKFTGSTVETRTVDIAIAKSLGSVIQAVLCVNMGLDRRDAPKSDFPAPEPAEAADSGEGIQGEAGATLMQPLEIKSACLMHAVNLFLTVLEPDTILSIFLIRDDADSGQTIFISEDISTGIKPSFWLRAALSEPVLVNSGMYHLSVKIHQGCMIWRTAPKAGALIQRTGPEGIGFKFSDTEGICLIEKSSSLAPVTDVQNYKKMLKVNIRGEELPLAESAGGPPDQMSESVACYDMHTVTALSSGTDERMLPITFSTYGRGMITVYAPEIIYDP